MELAFANDGSIRQSAIAGPAHDSAASEPLYVRLREHLRQQILSGALRTNDRLPSEPALVAQFGVSRVTVRQALRALRDEGLVRSAQGKGTFVSPPLGVQDSRSSIGFHQSMATLGFAAASEVVSVNERGASADVALALGLKRGTPVLELRRLRRLNGEPVSLELRYFPQDIGDVLKVRNLTRDILPLLESACGIRLGRAEVRIEAVPCAREHATRLKLKPGEPLLRIHRTTLDAAGRAVDYQQLHCRGDAYRFHCEMNLSRHAPGWRGEFAR